MPSEVEASLFDASRERHTAGSPAYSVLHARVLYGGEKKSSLWTGAGVRSPDQRSVRVAGAGSTTVLAPWDAVWTHRSDLLA